MMQTGPRQVFLLLPHRIDLKSKNISAKAKALVDKTINKAPCFDPNDKSKFLLKLPCSNEKTVTNNQEETSAVVSHLLTHIKRERLQATSPLKAYDGSGSNFYERLHRVEFKRMNPHRPDSCAG